MSKEAHRDINSQALLTCSKKIWTGEEDIKLKALIDEHGTCSWTKVGESFSERTGKQCRERWYNHLDPSVKKGEWTAEEDMILSTMQKTIGNQWAKITKALPGRTDNAIKNRFHATCRAQSRKDPGDYEKSSYNYDGNTDSDSNSTQESEITPRGHTDLEPNGPTIAMMHAHCPIMAYPSPSSFENGSLFTFANPVPYVFDNAAPSADPSQSYRSAIPTHGGSSLKSSKTHKCAKKSKKVVANSARAQQIPIEAVAISERHSSKVTSLNSLAWSNPNNTAQELLSDLALNNYPASQFHHRSTYPQQQIPTVISPASSRVSTSYPSPVLMPLPLPSSRAPGNLSSISDLPCAQPMYNRAAFNGLSLKERLAPAPMAPPSPTFSDDFKMNIPSTSSIDLDENLFDDWMDDDSVMGNMDYTNDIDVPFYRSSFDWGLTGCCNLASTATAGCFSSGQSAPGDGNELDSLCGFRRLSYGQGQPAAAPASGPQSTGFFSSLGGRICGMQKVDQSFEPDYQQGQPAQHANVYSANIKTEQGKKDFTTDNLISVHLQGQYNC